jgi:hypothetical protein
VKGRTHVKDVLGRYVRAGSLIAMGSTTRSLCRLIPPAGLRLSDQELDANERTVPSGSGPPYVAGDAARGAVGVDFSGSYAGGESAVTITQPLFADLPEIATMVAQADF